MKKLIYPGVLALIGGMAGGLGYIAGRQIVTGVYQFAGYSHVSLSLDFPNNRDWTSVVMLVLAILCLAVGLPVFVRYRRALLPREKGAMLIHLSRIALLCFVIATALSVAIKASLDLLVRLVVVHPPPVP